MINKSNVQEVSLDDLNELIANQVPENDRLEYKSALAGGKDDPDSWKPGSYVLAETSKIAIAREIVAFANANGGYLILGMKENDESPHYAKELSPIPNCAELQNRLMDSLSDCVDPLITCVTSKCIQIEHGFGVIVFHILRSPCSPHRVNHKRSKECFIRIGSSSKPMGMAEIQAATLRTNRHIVEGLWTGVLPQPSGIQVGCVFVLEAGKLFGGDSYFYYGGRYEVVDGMSLSAQVNVRHYAGETKTIFGDHSKSYTVNVGGVIVGEVIEATFSRQEFPTIKPRICFVRREYLP